MVKVAAVQMSISKSMRVNCEKIKQHIRNAAQKKVDIVCFPEVSLNGEDEPDRNPKSYLEEIQACCRDEKIHCIVGSYVPFRKKVKNSVFLIDYQGEILYRYNKVHLWADEKKTVTPGKKNKVVETKFGTIGIIDCWDFAFTEFSEKLAKDGAKIIFCPTYLVSYKKDGDVLKKIPLVKAFENLTYYISCDAYSKETLSESFICHPQKTLKHIKGKEGMIVSEIDLNEITKLRREYDHLNA